MESYIVQCFLVFNCITVAQCSKLFLVLVDGFRWDYFDLPGVELPGFSRFIQGGVKAEYMIPDFPTNSYPNYRTIETGLHVESHGFVGNYMYDDRTGDRFDFKFEPDTSDKWLEGSEAFYVTAEKQGVHAALYYVPTTTRNVSFPSYWIPYTSSPTRPETKWAIKDGLGRLRNGTADIVYLYYENVDRTGHFHGTGSGKLKDAVEEIDELLGDLLDDIDRLNLTDSLNVVVVSDHGMTDLKPNTLDISAAINMDDVKEITEAGTLVYIWPKEGKVDKLYDSLTNVSPHLSVYYKEDVFDRWFLKNHNLVPPLIVMAENGWYIEHPRSDDKYSGYYKQKFVSNHGYDNLNEDMRSIFIAKGPSFKTGYLSKPFSSVDAYQVFCHVTSLEPRPHNGTWDDVKDMLTDDTMEMEHRERHVDL